VFWASAWDPHKPKKKNISQNSKISNRDHGLLLTSRDSYQAGPFQEDIGVDGVTDVLSGVLLGVVVVAVVLVQQTGSFVLELAAAVYCAGATTFSVTTLSAITFDLIKIQRDTQHYCSQHNAT
jgi:hypothetical protein